MSRAVGPSYFYEDEVYRVSKTGDVEYGMVTENWEMYSSSDEEDVPGDKVLPGQVCVSWYPKGKEEVIAESKVKLSARSLMPGDVVRRLIAGKDTQRGYCRSVKVRAAVQVIGTKKVIPNISATDLVPVQKLTPEVAVYLDTWIGVIRDMKYRLHLKFADNSTCEVDSTLILEHFDDVRRGFDSFHTTDVFYPGQKLRGPMKFLKNADWTFCSDDMKRAKDRKIVTAVVIDVNPSSMFVQWQWQTPECPLETPPENVEWQKNPPPDMVKGDTLKRVKTLNLFESCTVQLGDVSYYTPKPGDIFIEKVSWRRNLPNSGSAHGIILAAANNVGEEGKGAEETGKNALVNKVDKELEHPSSLEEMTGSSDAQPVMEPMDTAAELTDPEKNNNSVSKGNSGAQPNKRALPRLSTKALRKKKLKKARPPSVPPPSIVQSLASQVVVETVHTNALVDVVWQDGTYEEGISSVELYPIHHLDDHEFFPGDFVIRADSSDPRTYGVIQRMDHAERVAVVKWFEAYSYAGEQKPKELEEAEMSVFDIKDHPDFRFRPGTIVIRVANLAGQSCGAGQIMDNYPDGQVRVWWANSTMTACWPQDLFRLGEYDSDEGEIWDDNGVNSDVEEGEEEDEPASDSSWVTETEEEVNESQAGPDSVHRYHTIGKLIDKIQSTLVKTRETIVASGSVSIENGVANSPSVAKLVNNEQPSLTKKLLLIYKDCQYLDKMMGTKFFDVDDLKNWYRGKEGVSSKSRRMIEQISRMFDIPADGKATLRRLSAGSDCQLPLTTSEPKLICTSTSQTSISGDSKEDGAGGETMPEAGVSDDNTGNSSNFLSYELCSIILNKLLKVHSEYQSRFGSTIIVTEDKIGGAAAAPPTTTINLGSDWLPFVKVDQKDVSTNTAATPTAAATVAPKESKSDQSNTNVKGSGTVVVEQVQMQKTGIIKGLFSRLFKGDCVNVTYTELAEQTATPESGSVDGENCSEATPAFEASSLVPISSAAAAAAAVAVTTELCPPETSEENVEEGPKSNFIVIESVPDTHRYRLTSLTPQNQKSFVKAVQKEVSLMRNSLPVGIFVKTYEDRMDLFSVMILGPEKTPYEDGIFFFDIQLPATYPSTPPLVHYVSFCTDRLNPNLYEEGKVCVSLLGTWSGKGTEVWTSSSSILQVLVSIQGLILVPEPYYNEAGYEKQRGSQQGMENSRMYNEMVLIKLVQSMSRMLINPPAPWEREAVSHIQKYGPRMVERYKKWLMASESQDLISQPEGSLPEFPLLPVSKGFSITLKKTLDNFAKLCATKQPSLSTNVIATNTTSSSNGAAATSSC